jgi:hypothetical protein
MRGQTLKQHCMQFEYWTSVFYMYFKISFPDKLESQEDNDGECLADINALSVILFAIVML